MITRFILRPSRPMTTAPFAERGVFERLFDPSILFPILLLLTSAHELRAQVVPAGDIEWLGLMNGTQPPPAYFEERARDPRAFTFSVEGLERLSGFQEASARDFQAIALQRTTQARTLGPRPEIVAGTIRFPVVLGTFSDAPPPLYTAAQVQEEFFTGPNSRGQTITQFYAEMSRGMLTLQGEATPWIQVPWTEAQVTLGQSALVSATVGGMGSFIEALVAALDGQGMDWTPYDRNGDGFVDIFTVLHPSVGGECRLDAGGGPSRIWSHRWSVSSATRGRLPTGVRTATPGPGPGGFIHVNDYTVQPLQACGGGEINQIGVFAHELGHAFGLPDLYSTNPLHRHAGAGNWDLMATGSWGCGFARDPARPCAMGAWSRAMLGWVDILDIPLDTEVGLTTLAPSIANGRALRVPADDGSGTYLLLENRQNGVVDQNLFRSGLLIWQIDPALVLAQWSRNEVNSDPERMGVFLRSADALGTLARPDGLRGSPGDPFPGCIKATYTQYLDSSIPCGVNRVFHAGSNPASVGWSGAPLGITVLGIEEVGSAPFDIRFSLSTRWSRISLAAEDASGAPISGAGFVVDGSAVTSGSLPFRSAPFQTHIVSAAAGPAIAEGVRVGFVGWEDGSARVRTVQSGLEDQTLTARYGGREVRVRWTAEGGAFGAEPGELLSSLPSSDRWFPEGATVAFEARPTTGFRFVDWVGAYSGAANPLELILAGPLDLAARFELTFGVALPSTDVALSGARALEVIFTVANATLPVQWSLLSGVLPEGLQFNAASGVISGVALEAGVHPITLRARDARGLEATAEVRLTVAPPAIPMDVLAGPYLGNGLEPSVFEKQFLDWNGNRDGFFDLGDLRAHLLRFGLPTGLAPTREAAVLLQIVPLGSLVPSTHTASPDAGDLGRARTLGEGGLQ
jgi:M6 family metalloprotease-like protein